MTRAEQFPDISMLIRAKRKRKLDRTAKKALEEINHSRITKFYARRLRASHYKLMLYLFVLFTGMYLLVRYGSALMSRVGY